jgi:molybdopterin-binding protein
MSSVRWVGTGRALVAAASAALLVACATAPPATSALVDGAGPVMTETRSVGAFDKVEVHHGIDLRLAIGSPMHVLVTAQENLLAMTTTTVSDGRLIVEAMRDFVSNAGITASVTMPAVTELDLRDGATGDVRGLDAAMLVVHADHGSTLTMTGTAGWLGLSSHGACVIDLSGFVASDATVELAQGVVVQIGVSGAISGSATGGVVLTITGDPRTVDVRTSGGSTVISR